MTTRQDATVVNGQRAELRALTGVRGVAATWVLLFHLAYAATQLAPGTSPWFGWFGVRSGYLAVDIFFVLSGFVLAMVHGRTTPMSGPHRLGAFYLERALRIGPLNAVILGLFVALAPLLQHSWLNTQPHDAGTLIACLALVQQWGRWPLAWNVPGWSLSAESAAYVVFPLLVAAVSRLRSMIGCMAVLVALVALEAAWVMHAHGGSLDQTGRGGLVRCALGFASGVVLWRAWSAFPPSPRTSDLAFVASLATFAATLALRRVDALAVPAAVLLVFSCAGGGRLAEHTFGNRVVHVLGRLSFSLYLVHWLLIECAAWAVRERGLPAHACLASVLLLASPLAALLHAGVERPFQRLGRRVSSHLQRRST